ncbi:MAG: T9SS type A sorting domain-containing protein [Chitinophagales bacterium]|nr:T9SS type A sorting domain-containing protein [Chitinophagales bacterium]
MSEKNFAQGITYKDCIGEIADCESEAVLHRLGFIATAPSQDYDLKYARLYWTIDPDTLFIQGTVTFYLQIVNATNLLFFDCSDTLSIDSIKYHGSQIVYHQLPGDILQVDLTNNLTEGSMDSLSISYHGIPVSTGFGSYQQTQVSGINNIWTLSEPYGAKDWWPCKQTLNDKIDSIDSFITIPVGNLAGTAGLLIKCDTEGSWVTMHWKHRYPIASYLIGISVTKYAAFSVFVPDGSDSIPILNYVFPDQLQYAEESVPSIISPFQLYSSLFGEYPFKKEKYGHMQFGWGGGEEHQTMSSMANFGYEIMVHELAHQWFGDKVTCGSWNDVWLNEGFATYLTGLCYENFSPQLYWPIWKSQTVGNIISQPNGSVFVDDTTSVDRIFSSRLSYKKGSYLLHMLRWKIGDSSFFKGIREYLNDPGLAYSYARTIDLKSHLESVSGMDLTSFFSEWFYGQGFPSYQLFWSQDKDNLVKLVLYQSTSDVTVPFFDLPVPVRFKSANDSTDLRFDLTSGGELFSAQLNFKADTAIIDPDFWLISGNNTVNKIAVSPQSFFIGIFPTITTDIISAQNFDLQPHSGSIRIYDMAGRLKEEKAFSFDLNQPLLNISLKNLAAGLYFLRIETEASSFTQRVLKY